MINELVTSGIFDVQQLHCHSLPHELTNDISASFEATYGKHSVPYYYDDVKKEYEAKYHDLYPVHTSNNKAGCITDSPKFQQKLREKEIQENEKLSPYNLLTTIYTIIRPFLASDLRALFADTINQSKQWRQ